VWFGRSDYGVGSFDRVNFVAVEQTKGGWRSLNFLVLT
jgi:hypothetical protein